MLDKKRITQEVLDLVKELTSGKVRNFDCNYDKKGKLLSATLIVDFGKIAIEARKQT